MSKKASIALNGFRLELFSEAELKKIHLSTLHTLEAVGFVADGHEALELFAAASAKVDFTTHLVKLPPHMVEEAIRTAPPSIYLAGRGDKGFRIGDDVTRFCSFGEAPQIIDVYTQEVRNVTKQDEADYAKLIDALPEHDMCWDAWVASDVPSATYTLHSFEAYLNNTVKPVCVATPNGVMARATVDMALAVAGSEQSLRERPICIAGTCPKGPLHLDQGICESIIILARAGIPNMNMSALTTGGTGPVTLAGTIVIHNAEMLACLVLSQLAAKGAPCIYGACTSALDLRRATATYGCPELGMFSAAFAALTHDYGLPNVVAGFWSDSKTSDMQSGHEKTVNGLLPALAGADMIFGSGCLAAGMIGSFGQLVADDEMITMVRRIMRGIPVEDEGIALDVITQVGPKGHFLAEPHTVAHMKEAQAQPLLLDRSGYHDWLAEGRQTFAQRADARAVALLEDHKPAPLPAQVRKELQKIIAAVERDLGIAQIKGCVS